MHGFNDVAKVEREVDATSKDEEVADDQMEEVENEEEMEVEEKKKEV